MNIGILLVKHMMLTNVITASASMTVKETIEILYNKPVSYTHLTLPTILLV